jgi:hypothetical protein
VENASRSRTSRPLRKKRGNLSNKSLTMPHPIEDIIRVVVQIRQIPEQQNKQGLPVNEKLFGHEGI